MPKGKKNVASPTKKPRVSKMNAWLFHFTNESNPKTFMNRRESARAAGYKTTKEDSLAQIGSQNFNKLNEKISQWLDESGLSENALKIKIVSLMEAKETKFQSMKGAVNPESLPGSVQILATTGVIEYDEEGGQGFGTGDTLLAIETENPELQRRALDMAIKVKGMYAAEKKEVSGKDGKPIQLETGLSPAAEEKLLELIHGPSGT